MDRCFKHIKIIGTQDPFNPTMYGLVTAVIFLLVSAFFSSETASNSLMGPYDLVFKYTERCPEVSVHNSMTMNLRMMTRRSKLVLNVKASLPYELSDDLGFSAAVASRKNGGWKADFLKFQSPGGICTACRKGRPDLFGGLAKSVNAPPKCPLPPGNYSYESADHDAASFLKGQGLYVLPYGEFRLESNFTVKRKLIYCHHFYIDVVPKKIKGR